MYQLLGGKVRDRARVYYHVFGSTREELVSGVADAKRQGFTAVGHLTPFLDSAREEAYFKTHADKIADAIDAVRQYRAAVGNDVDLCIEIHRRMTPTEAVQLGRGIEEFHPYFFFEDPVTPDNFDEMEYVAQKINIPIATGERFTSLWEFQMALQRNAVQYVRPDVCMVGGISGAKKVARAGRGATREGGAAQSAQSGEYGGVFADRGLYPELRAARVSDRGGPAAEERLSDRDCGARRSRLPGAVGPAGDRRGAETRCGRAVPLCAARGRDAAGRGRVGD